MFRFIKCCPGESLDNSSKFVHSVHGKLKHRQPEAVTQDPSPIPVFILLFSETWALRESYTWTTGSNRTSKADNWPDQSYRFTPIISLLYHRPNFKSQGLCEPFVLKSYDVSETLCFIDVKHYEDFFLQLGKGGLLQKVDFQSFLMSTLCSKWSSSFQTIPFSVMYGLYLPTEL